MDSLDAVANECQRWGGFSVFKLRVPGMDLVVRQYRHHSRHGHIRFGRRGPIAHGLFVVLAAPNKMDRGDGRKGSQFWCPVMKLIRARPFIHSPVSVHHRLMAAFRLAVSRELDKKKQFARVPFSLFLVPGICGGRNLPISDTAKIVVIRFSLVFG